jgi:kynurenine 3-monooxygenase
MSKISIIGAGAAGASLSLLLRSEGHEVDLFDGRPDPRGAAGAAYKSIAVTLSERGFRVLRSLGLEEELQRRSRAVAGRVMHSRTGEAFTQIYDASGQVLRCVSRLNIDLMLLEAAQKEGGVGIHFLHECVDLNIGKNQVTFKDKNNSKVIEVESDYVIAADGPGSQIRQKMEARGLVKSEAISFPGGYKEFLIPPDKNGNWALDPGYVHMWPRGDFVFILFPVLAGEFIGMLFLPNDSNATRKPEAERDFVGSEFADLVALAPNIVSRYVETPIMPLRRLRCRPWSYSERFTLIGDAAHTILPFYGQGMNASLEDCEILAQCLGRHQLSDSPLADYEYLRKPNADAIDELALEHYHYLSRFAETKESIRKKELEAELNKRFPSEFVPIYTLVAFTSLPYKTCQKMGELQGHLLDQLVSCESTFSWESQETRKALDDYLQANRKLRHPESESSDEPEALVMA